MSIVKNERGFSLVELSIVLVIIGLLLGPMLSFMNLYFKEKARRITYESLNSISLALGQYYNRFGHYPCPSRLNAKTGDADFGMETVCGPIKDNSSGSLSAKSARTGGTCMNGICSSIAANGDTIKAGAIPNKALGLPFEKSLDGFGDRITYAITERFAVAGPQTQHLGAISIRDDTGKSLIDPPGSAQFIVVSHGRDGKGSYTADGTPNGLKCGDRPGIDNENCNNDDVFIDGEHSEVSGNHYYDDTVMYKMYGGSLLWQSSPFDDKNIYNVTLGNVGIGTQNPQEKLDVNGNIRAMGSLYAAKLCNADGKDCFEPQTIGGAGISCGDGSNESMIGIRNAQPLCAPIKIKPVQAQSCPPGQFATGFTLDGGIICQLPNWWVHPVDILNVQIRPTP